MNSPLRTHFITVILLATVGNILFWLFNHSIDTFFIEQQSKSDYISFYLPICLGAFAIGSLQEIGSLNHKFWKIGVGMLLMVTLLAILVGSIFTYTVRTDEYVLYFLTLQIFWLLFLAVLGIYLRHLIQSSLKGRQKNHVIITGMLCLFIVNALLTYVNRMMSFPIHELLIFNAIILGSMLWLAMKTDSSSKQSESSNLESQEISGVKKNFRFVPTVAFLALVNLISIFFVVYSNIQTNLAREQEQMTNYLLEECQQYQQATKEAAENAAVKNIELQQELENCRGGE